MTKWTAPDIASIRGDNSRPLQKIFGSLTEYLKDSLSEVNEVSQTYVRNGETTDLTIGTVVYLAGQQGDRATVKRAYNTSDATSAKTLGVVAELIPPNGDGLVTTLGYLEKINTSAFTAGQTVYLSATAGQFTATKPYAPNHLVYVGVVIRANAGNGILYVRCQNGYELDEIHDVQIVSPTQGQTIAWDATSSLWKNITFSDGGGLTNLNASNLASGTVPSARMTGSYTGITGLGTITAGTWNGSIVAGQYGGTGIANTGKTITVGGNFTTSGAFTTTLTVTGNTSVTLPTSGTLATTDASSLTSGTLNNARLPAAATTITSVGTLTSLSVNGSNANSPLFTIGDWNQNGDFTALRSPYGYLLLGSAAGPNYNIYLRTETASGQVIIGGGANANIFTVTGSYASLAGMLYMNNNNIGDAVSTANGANQIYATGWFRSWGDSGWYNQSYGGGVYMVDTTFVRIYNSKIFYASNGIWSVDSGTASTSGFQYLLRGATYGNYAPFTSMREVKRNIQPITNSGLLVDQLNPVTFQEKITDTDDAISIAWKDADLEYGFIADEVALVGTGHLAQYQGMEDGTLKPVGWSFHGMVSLLAAEVKDLRSRLKALEGAK